MVVHQSHLQIVPTKLNPAQTLEVCNLSADRRPLGKNFIKYSAVYDVCLCGACQELERQIGVE